MVFKKVCDKYLKIYSISSKTVKNVQAAIVWVHAEIKNKQKMELMKQELEDKKEDDFFY